MIDGRQIRAARAGLLHVPGHQLERAGRGRYGQDGHALLAPVQKHTVSAGIGCTV